MKKTALALTAALVATLGLTAPAFAALKVGDAAPAFSIPVAKDGVVSTFSLKDALKSGPVVVYFYPKAFTGGCSLEAHQFSEAIPEFQAKHVSVVGVSTDDIDTLKRFSKESCQGKFPVASDNTQNVMKSYDAVMALRPDYANRVSYVIAPNGKVIYNYQSLNPSRHVEKTLAALKDWSQSKK